MKRYQRLRFKIWLFGSLGAILLLSGCRSDEPGSYQSNKLYSESLYGQTTRRAFAYEGPERNPVILIHGLLGAELRDHSAAETVVWGQFALWGMLAGDESNARLALPMQRGVPLRALASSVQPVKMLDRSAVDVVFFRFYLENYEPLIDLLAETGYVPDCRPMPADRHFYSQFVFYYDWRRDIAENAARLDEFLQRRRRDLQAQYEARYGVKDYDVHFDLIGHSMGGLLARYYLAYGAQQLPDEDADAMPIPDWRGAEYVDKAIMIATPNAGYTDTLLELTSGLRLSAVTPPYPPEVVGTFVSMYEMLPFAELNQVRYRDDQSPVDYFDPQLWARYNWGLANRNLQISELNISSSTAVSETDARGIAYDHLTKCLKRAKYFHEALRRAGEVASPETLAFYLFVGDGGKTNYTLGVDRATGALSVMRHDVGDGKVAVDNARFDRRTDQQWHFYMDSPIPWRNVIYLPGAHMGILRSQVLADNLRAILLCSPNPQAISPSLPQERQDGIDNACYRMEPQLTLEAKQ